MEMKGEKSHLSILYLLAVHRKARLTHTHKALPVDAPDHKTKPTACPDPSSHSAVVL